MIPPRTHVRAAIARYVACSPCADSRGGGYMRMKRHAGVFVAVTLGLLLQDGASLNAGHDDEHRHRGRRPDWHVRSTPGNVTWGEFPSSKPPVAIVQSGQTV